MQLIDGVVEGAAFEREQALNTKVEGLETEAQRLRAQIKRLERQSDEAAKDAGAAQERAAELEKALGKKAIIERRPAQPGDVERTFADLSRSSAELGYRPQTTLSEGLRKFVEWFGAFGHLYP